MKPHAITLALLAPMLMLALVSCGDGEQRAVRTIDWDAVSPLAGEVVDGRLVIDAAGEARIGLISIDGPGIAGPGYVVSGDVSYEGIDDPGYLEMWSIFAEGEAYFTRTLADGGPLAALSGTSGAREFELPFFMEGDEPPRRLEINVVLPAGGHVSIGVLTLRPLADRSGGAWWSERSGAWVGALSGSAAGLLGAAVGILSGRRQARRFLARALPVITAVGVALVAAGIVAVIDDQPRWVWFPLVLVGSITALVFGLLRMPLQRASREDELRRIRAME